MDEMIKSVLDYPPIKGVERDIDEAGRGNAEPIEGHEVVLTVPMSELKKD